MVIVIIGPSGSGKDTQANLLVNELNLPNISTGKILREEIDSGSELGKAASAEMEKGNWIDDDMMYQLLVKRITKPDCDGGFILNGFPRTHHQIDLLNDILRDCNQNLRAVVHFSLDEEEVLRRMHKQVAETEQRPDISDAAMQQRLRSYKATIDPILEQYERQGVLLNIDAHPSIEEVHAAILKGLGIK